MKKTTKYFLLVALLLLLLKGVVFAQAKWVPLYINISVPTEEGYTEWNDPHFPRYGTQSKIVTYGADHPLKDSSIHLSYSRVGDTISINYNFAFPPPGNTKIWFVLDSQSKQIQQFSLVYDYDHSDGSSRTKEITSILFSSLDYDLTDDTLLSVGYYGPTCQGSLVSVKREYSYDNGVTGIHSFHKDSQTSKILDDTLNFSCFLVFALSTPVNSVYEFNSKLQELTISTSLPDHTINFTLPSSPHPETLFIYDLLGRETARVEIAAGMTQYSMNSSRFPSGHYFARLGNSSSHFEVVQ